MKLNGAEITIKLLEQHGITKVAGIPGGANLPLYDALFHSTKINHILARHEQGAGFMAQGMARSTGKPAVCFATSGPGATNIVTALADAYLDSIPVICITGQVPLSLIGTDAFQEVDVYGLSIPITKHNFLVRSVDELLSVIPKAFRMATDGRPGPILVDIPKDVQMEEIECSELPDIAQPELYPSLETTLLEKAATLINQAKRPVFYVGGGITQCNGEEMVHCFAEKCSLPTTMSLMGLGALAPEHPLYMGMLGMHAARSTNILLEECDLLIAAGVRFDDRATGKIGAFCPQAKIIHIDIDPSEIDKLKTSTLGLVGEVGSTLASLFPLVTEKKRMDWVNRLAILRKKYPFFCDENFNLSSPYGLIMRIAEAAGDKAIVATDVGKHQMWTAQVYPFQRTRQFLTSGGLGTMGFGLPTSIGAALAHPDKTVVCISGDGSIMMNIQELATAAELNVNVKIIVLNNQSLGLVRQQQKLFYSAHFMASEYSRKTDIASIAKGFGIRAFDSSQTTCSDELLQTVFQTSGPCLVNIDIDINEDVFPMVPPGAANSVMIGEEYECA